MYVPIENTEEEPQYEQSEIDKAWSAAESYHNPKHVRKWEAPLAPDRKGQMEQSKGTRVA